MTAWAEIERDHAELRTIRAREESRWRDIGRLMQSDEDFTSDAYKNGRSDGDDPFDSTPLYAHDDFVGGTFTKAVNPAERWFSFGVPDDPDLAAWKPVQEYLWKVTGVVNSSLDPTYDNFYLNAPSWFGDMGMFGSGFEWQEERIGRGTITSRVFPIGECYKAVDADGELVRFHREFSLTGRQAKGKWRDHPVIAQIRDDATVKFVLALFENPDYRPGSPFQRHMRWRSCYVSPDKRDFIAEGGYNELPVHQIEWAMRSGKVWARGPGHNALADMRGNDEVVRATYTGIQFDAEPMWWARDDDVMSMADIAPGNLLYGDAERGQPPVQVLERAKAMSLPLKLIEDGRNQIRRAFRFGLSQVLAGRPQMTAQEVLAYTSDELKALAPNLVRIHRGLGGYLNRRVRLLDRAGVIMAKIGPPPPELQRAGVSVQFVSPFAKAQQADVAKGVIGWVNTKIELQGATNNPEWTDDIDVDGVSTVLHDALSGVPSIKLDQRLVAQKRESRAAAMAQQAQLAQQEQAAAIVADVSHAQQASTLAKGRARG